METLSKVVAVILVTVLFFLFPLDYLMGHQLTVYEGLIEEDTSLFVNDIKEKKYLDTEMYEGFIEKLHTIGEKYDVEIEHAIPREGNDLTRLDELPGVLVVSRELSSLSVHTHSGDCYAGDLHVCNKIDCEYEGKAIAVAVHNGFGGGLYRTENGSTWTKTLASDNLCDVTYGNGIFVAIDRWNTYVSSDGTNWTSTGVKISGSQMELLNIVYGSGYFYASARYAGHNSWEVLKSVDGVSWTFGASISTQPPKKGMAYVKSSSGGYLYTGSPDGYIRYTVDQNGYLRNSSFATLQNSGVIRQAGNAMAVTHAYGMRYISGLYPYDKSPNPGMLQFGNGMYIALKDGIYATNDISGNFHKISDFSLTQYYDVIYYGDRYMMTGYDGSRHRVCTSIDGVTWNNVISPAKFSELACNTDNGSGEIDRGECLKTGKYYDNNGNEVHPVCDRVVTSITALNSNQTVNEGGSIDTRATATYLDGHTGIVTCTSNFNPSLIGTQSVILTYTGLVGNAKTTGTRTCTITVTVRSGAPISLKVIPSSYTVYNGTEPTYEVIVTYEGGYTKTITTGYTKTGWSSGPGIKILVFSYTESGKTVTATVTITVKQNLTGITVIPAEQSVERYDNPSITVIAFYEDGSSMAVTGYSKTGFDPARIGIQNVTVRYVENYIEKTCVFQVEVTPMKRTCLICGNDYYLDENDFDRGCPDCRAVVSSIEASPDDVTIRLGEPLNITVTATYLDGHTEAVTGWSSNFNPDITGSQLVKITNREKYDYVSVTVLALQVCDICGQNYALNIDGTDPGCSYCRENVVSITASPGDLTVNQGEEINLLVTALYRNGQSKEVTGWHSDYNRNRPGKQLVTVYYKSATCTVTVNVISGQEVACPTCGTIYSLTQYRWGCPVCAGTLVAIEAVLRNGGTRVPVGRELKLRVVLWYRDGHRELVFEGWEDDFHPQLPGEQTVTVSYTDHYDNTVSCELLVYVVEGLEEAVCENGHVYYRNHPDDPCPYCSSDTLNQEKYFDCIFTEDILDRLYTDGIYRFSTGDFITVRVTLRLEGSFYSFRLVGKKKDPLPISYGGEVS